jgi:hypothetical protein
MVILGVDLLCCVFRRFGFGCPRRVVFYRLLRGPELVPCLDANLCSFVRPPVPSEFAFAISKLSDVDV